MNVAPKRSRALLGFDMTPMIDVTLQLIIFFLFTQHFANEAKTPMDLPRQKGEKSAYPSDPLAIAISPEGGYSIAGQAMPIESVVQTVAQAAKDAGGGDRVRVLVRADRRASASHLNLLADRLQALDVRAWELGTAEVEP